MAKESKTRKIKPSSEPIAQKKTKKSTPVNKVKKSKEHSTVVPQNVVVEEIPSQIITELTSESIIQETSSDNKIIINGIVYQWGRPKSGADLKLLTSANGLVLSSCISNTLGEFRFELDKIPIGKTCVKCYYGGIMKKKDVNITSEVDTIIFNF